MKAVVHTRYGPPGVLRLAEVERPTPRDEELLVRVHATTVNRTDCGFRKAEPIIVRLFSGLLRPRKRILGSELAGRVEAIGRAVTEFAIGDRVFGVNANRFGTHAEYVCVAQDAAIATMPTDLGFEEAAAACDGAILALTYLRRAGIGAGRRILIYGASGSIGTAAVQLAKHAGAHVTAVCHTRSLDTIRSLGADAVLDCTRQDFTASGDTYDIVFDAVGKLAFARCKPSLVDGGIYMSTDLGPHWQNPVLAALTSRRRMKKVLFPLPRYTKQDVLYLKELIEAGSYRPVIDRRYPLEQIVEATRYVETEQKTGNVVLVVIEDDRRCPASHT